MSIFKQALINGLNQHLESLGLDDAVLVLDLTEQEDQRGYAVHVKLYPNHTPLNGIRTELHMEADISHSELFERVQHARELYMFGTY